MSDTELITAEPVPFVADPPSPALTDFRNQFMSAPVEVMQAALSEYRERRNCFRDWLKSQLIEGVHFGYVPSFEPKYSADGTHFISNGKPVPLTQWQPKPALYKSGAEFICDLLYVIDTYEADLDGWKMAGSPDGLFVYKCQLRSKNSGELLGEGRGCRRIGDKKMDANGTIKMAKKNAKVDAVLSAFGLSDLFSQDEESEQPPHDNPPADPSAPKTASRDGRCTKEAIVALKDRWRKFAPDGTADEWTDYVARNCGRRFDALKASEWQSSDAMSVDSALRLDGV